MNYSDLHKALDEAAYEVLRNYRRRIAEQIDKLEAEKSQIDDEIERIELKGRAA